ncbi:MAG: hypothetical protein ACN4GZ_18395 [Acidimicrobiales bacterium]
MTKLQIFRLAAVSLAFAATQVAGFDRFLLFGVGYLALPLFLAIAVGGRLPFTNAALAGAFVGLFWDLLSIDLFGRYALALALCAGAASLATFASMPPGRVERIARRALSVGVGLLVLASVSALSGETLPVLNGATAVGLVVSLVVGTLVSGSLLNRIALPSRTVWDPAEERATEWVDRRAGLYSVPATSSEREAA